MRHSSTMSSFRYGHAAVLLFAFVQSLVSVSSEDAVKSDKKASIEMGLNSLQDSWMKEIESVIPLVESSCTREIMALIGAIKSEEMWALQMLDASSKIPSGILRGNTHGIGMYNECVGVRGEYNNTKVRGRYCTISFDPVSSKAETVIRSPVGSFSSSLCVPSSCDETHIDQILNVIIQSLVIIEKFEPTAFSTQCVQIESEAFTTGEILTIVFFSMVGAFVIFCTVCDLLKRTKLKNSPTIVNELAKFSLYTNGISLLSTKVTPQTMPAVQGIRFLSISWIVLGHRYTTSLLRPTINLLEIPEWNNSWNAVYIQAGPFAVDTFFVVSGFLMSYMYLKSKQSGKKSNFHMMYIHRYLRLTPCLAVLILFVAFLLHRTVTGPARKYLLYWMVDNCRQNWWIDLLYVQNFFNEEKMCLIHTWYLAVDMQLFWISPIILYPLYRWPKYGLGVLSLFFFASVVTPAVILTVNNYSNAMFREDLGLESAVNGFFKFYIATYNRACAYLMGIFLGYDIVNKKRHLSQINVAINWVAMCILMLFCGWAIHHVYDSNFAYNLVLESVLAIVLRPFWSIAIAWLIYACTQGYGGPVTRFLSLPFFQPLSRLSYCIYLVHLVIQVTKIVAAETPGMFSDFNAVNDYWADMVLSIAVAFILSLFIESPVIVLEKLVTNRGRKSNLTNLVQRPKKDLEMGSHKTVSTEEEEE